MKKTQPQGELRQPQERGFIQTQLAGQLATKKEKNRFFLSEVGSKLGYLFKDIQDNMYNSALKRRNSMIYEANSWEEFKDIATNKPGFIKANWCGDEACEKKIKYDFGMKSRCLIDDEEIHTNCVVCGKKAKYRLYFGRQY